MRDIDLEGGGRQSIDEERPLLADVENKNHNVCYESTLVTDEVKVPELSNEQIVEAAGDERRVHVLDELRIQIDNEVREPMDDPWEIIELLTKKNENLLIINDILYYALTRVLEKTRTLDLKVRLYEERKCDTEWIETMAEDARATFENMAEDAKATYKQEPTSLTLGEDDCGEEHMEPDGITKTVTP